LNRDDQDEQDLLMVDGGWWMVEDGPFHLSYLPVKPVGVGAIMYQVLDFVFGAFLEVRIWS